MKKRFTLICCMCILILNMAGCQSAKQDTVFETQSVEEVNEVISFNQGESTEEIIPLEYDDAWREKIVANNNVFLKRLSFPNPCMYPLFRMKRLGF